MSIAYESKFDGDLRFESKELNLIKPVMIQLNKILSKFNGGLNITDPYQSRDDNQEYQDYIDGIHEQLNFLGCGYGYGWDTHNCQYTRDIFLINMIKLSVLKNRLSGILSVGHPSFSVVSGILSVLGTHTHTRGNSVDHVWFLGNSATLSDALKKHLKVHIY